MISEKRKIKSPEPVYSTGTICEIVNGKLLQGNSTTIIHTLLMDSRKAVVTEDALFFAIRGERHDGHQFLKDVYEKGIRNFLLSSKPATEMPEANIILVDDSLKALQQLAIFHRKQFSLPVIGITGSNGKTVVKEWLHQLLSKDQHMVRSPKSYNSQVGVPLSVWQLNRNSELAVFEAGISKPGEMKRLEPMILPSIGVFTNIGDAHSENFSSLKVKANEKLKLFGSAKLLIYCKDDKVIEECIKEDKTLSAVRKIGWSKNHPADIQIGTSVEKDKTHISATTGNKSFEFDIPFTDEASRENAIHCFALLHEMGYDEQEIKNRMMALAPVAMRLELKEAVNRCTLINDSYNSDIGSLGIALDFLKQQNQHAMKTVILSDIFQSGKQEEELYSEIAALLKGKQVNRLIGIGKAISRNREKFHLTDQMFYLDTDDFIAQIQPSLFNQEAVLLKGARNFGFERIGKILEKKTHRTELEINLNAMVHNLNYFRSRLKPDVKIMVMVKALSYGSGSYEIANVLQFHRADYLGVAYTDEGVELRRAGIQTPVMVINPDPGSYEALIKYRLEPEIYSLSSLQGFIHALNICGNSDLSPFPIHLKLETGMHRLGFEDNDTDRLLMVIKNNSNLTVKSVFSHLAAVDKKKHDKFTRKQIALFEKRSRYISEQLGYPHIRHILNSAGIVRFPEACMEMVRLGIGLYGVGVTKAIQDQLQQMSTLKTTVSQIKQIRPGATIGYDRSAKAEKDMTIAIVPVGYADGLRRSLGNGKGKMFIRGKAVPVIGNICMDMCMLDVSHAEAIEGEEVIVFGNEHPVTEFAKDLDTIPYEVLTGISSRVKRVYYQE